ncbi:MAG: Rieske 2Fe-2S domain-containing protein [Pseudomonadota bacterium]
MPETTDRRTVICHLDELNDPDSRGLTLCVDKRFYDVFIVRRGQQVFGYLNSCPHTGGPLDWVPDQFLNLDRNYIQCATHDALFRLNDGHCIAGPCAGDRLTPVPVLIDAGEIVVVCDDFPAAGY